MVALHQRVLFAIRQEYKTEKRTHHFHVFFDLRPLSEKFRLPQPFITDLVRHAETSYSFPLYLDHSHQATC